MSEVTVARVADQGMIALRGAMEDLGPVLQVAGLSAPPQRGILYSDLQGSVNFVTWMSPDEAMVFCPLAEAPDLARRMAEEAGDAFVTVADLSDARAVFDLRGPWADDALAKLTPADVSAIEINELRRTRLAQVAGAVWRTEGGWRIVCFRSVGAYVEGLLRNAVEGGPLTPA